MDLNELPEKTIGVIAFKIEDFLQWKLENNHRVVLGNKDTKRIYVCNNIKYVCILTVNNCRGYAFDEIFETDLAKENPRYNEIRTKIHLK